MNGAEAIAGRFELVNPHARGSMGEVHRGPNLLTGDTVALKLTRRRTGEEVSLTEADKERRQVQARGADHVAAAEPARMRVLSRREYRAGARRV